MRKNIGKYICFILGIIGIILLITLISIKISSVNAKTSEKNIKDKIKDEIAYLDSNLIEIMNKLNNIEVIKYKIYTKEINDSSSQEDSSNQGGSSSQDSSSSQNQSSNQGSSSQQSNSSNQNSSNNQGSSSSENNSSSQSSELGENSSSNANETKNSQVVSSLIPNATLEQNNDNVDWTEISFLLENIYSTMPTIKLDLQKQGISEDLISSFSVSIDGAIQSIKNKDKTNALVNLFNSYINLPKYIESIGGDEYTINLYNTKANILNALVLASVGNKWDNILTNIQNAKSNFALIVSSDNGDENRKNQLQKTQILIDDLERMAKINDKEIFFIGYKNVMQDLQML